jgi:glycosyltransferase involved in cell wall biosynthesis
MRQSIPDYSDEILDFVIDENEEYFTVHIYSNFKFVKVITQNNFCNNVFHSFHMASARLYAAILTLNEYTKEKEIKESIYLFSDSIYVNFKDLYSLNTSEEESLLFFYGKLNDLGQVRQISEIMDISFVRLDLFVIKSTKILARWIELINKSILIDSRIINTILTLIIEGHAKLNWEGVVNESKDFNDLFPDLITVKFTPLQSNLNPSLSLASFQYLKNDKIRNFFLDFGNFYSKTRMEKRIRYLNEIERNTILNFRNLFEFSTINSLLQICYDRKPSSLSVIERNILSSRIDLQIAFQNSIKNFDYSTFYTWLIEYGINEYDLKTNFIPNSLNRGTFEKDDARPEVIYAVVGYPRSPLGVGMGATYLYNYLNKIVKPLYLVDVPLDHLKNNKKNLNLNAINIDEWIERTKSFDTRTRIIYIVCINGDRQLDWLKIKELKRDFDYFIGYFVWELDVYPTRFDFGLELVDEIWVPTTFVKKTFQQKTSLPINVIPHPIDIPSELTENTESLDSLLSRIYQSSENREYFFFSFDFYSCMYRKNVLFLIEAYSRAKIEDDNLPNLIIKCINKDDFPQDYFDMIQKINDSNSIFLLEEVISHEEILLLIKNSKGVVGLQKSEGYGLLIAEALSLGKWVICTDYGGPKDFIDDKCAILVDYYLESVDKKSKEYGVYHDQTFWANPYLEDSVKAFAELNRKSQSFNFEGIARIEKNNEFFYSNVEDNLQRILRNLFKKNRFGSISDIFK